MSRDLTVRPLALGEVIDWAVALTRRHFRTLFPLMLLVQVPALALYRFQAGGLQEALALAARNPASASRAATALLPGSAALAVVFGFLQLATAAAAAAVVAPSLEGRPRPPALAEAARSFGARAWPVASAALVQMAALGLAPLLGVVPGALLLWRSSSPGARILGLSAALLGATVLFLVVLLRLVLAPAVAGVEGLGGLRALARSSRLMAPGRGLSLRERPGLRASILLFATFLLALAVNGLAGLPRALAVVVSGRGMAASLPLAAELGLGIFEALVNAAVQPFGLVALAVFYFDRRARREGLDLEIWAREMGGRAGGRS